MENEIRKSNTTKEERKEKALEFMQKLDIYKPYIKGFEKSDNVCFFEGFAGYWAWQKEEKVCLWTHQRRSGTKNRKTDRDFIFFKIKKFAE